MAAFYNNAEASPLPKPVGEITPEKPTQMERTPSPQQMHMAMSPEGVAVHSPFPTAICPCPTCDYYRASMMYYHDAASPNVDSYTMYQNPMMVPQMPMMMPAANVASSPSNSNSQSHGRSTSPVNTMPSPSTLDQFEKGAGKLSEMACTSQGRSVLQSILAMQHVDKIAQIFDEMIPALETVILDQHGCHVVRSMIEVLDDAQVQRLVNEMNETLILNMCTVSQYTRRVLQALFERHNNSDLQAIVEIMHKNAQYLSATQQGCISLMRVFEQCSINQKMLLLEPIRPMFADLACDPFGNYVVQCVLENSPKSVASRIVLECFSGSMLKMSCNKFASNVMEKLISNMNIANVRRVILDELVFNPAALQQLVHDNFGNFVVQAIIDSCNHAGEFKKITDRLRSALPNSPFGHKIETKMRNKRFNTQQPRFGAQSTQRNAVAAY